MTFILPFGILGFAGTGLDALAEVNFQTFEVSFARSSQVRTLTYGDHFADTFPARKMPITTTMAAPRYFVAFVFGDIRFGSKSPKFANDSPIFDFCPD